MPILGIIASAITGNINTTAYQSISTVTVSSPVATVTFSSIPANFKHLQVRAISRSTRSNLADELSMTINGNSLTKNHYLYGDGSSMAFGSATAGWTGISSAATATASIFGASIIDILDYADTNKNKTVRSLSGFDSNGGGEIYMLTNFINNTSAVTSLVFTCGSGNFAQYSSLALYGIKGA